MSIDAILSKIDEIAYTDKFALNWADDFSSAVSENDMLERLGLSEDDMKDYSEQERKEHILGAAKDWIYDRSVDFDSEFRDKAKWDDGLILHRCIAVDNVKKFVKNLENKKFDKGYLGIGVYWSWNEDAAECHWGKGSEYVTVVGRVPLSAIDFKRTAHANFDQSTSEEDEITVKAGSKVEILGVKNANSEELLSKIKKLKVAAGRGSI